MKNDVILSPLSCQFESDFGCNYSVFYGILANGMSYGFNEEREIVVINGTDYIGILQSEDLEVLADEEKINDEEILTYVSKYFTKEQFTTLTEKFNAQH